MTLQKTQRKYRLLLSATVMLVLLGPLSAATFQVQLNRGFRAYPIPAEEIRGRIWLNAHNLSRAYGAKDPKIYRKEIIFEFEDHTVVINLEKSTYRVRPSNSRRWAINHFDRRPYVDQNQLMIPLSAVPDFLNTSFTYHWQKKELGEKRQSALESDQKIVSVPFQILNNKIWVPLKPMAEALNSTLYTNQANEYQLIMPDFSILTLRIGENWVFRRNIAYVRLTQPILVLAGEPHISMDSLLPLYGVDVKFNSKTKQFMIPRDFFHWKGKPDLNRPHVVMLGFKPEGFQFHLKELSSFYQNPIPTFAAEHLQQYDSVRDFLTNEPMRPEGSGWDHINGQLSADMEGHIAKIPFSSNGMIQKVGAVNTLSNGSFSWGFPIFKIQGSRSFDFNGFNNQFNVLDQVAVSHSNDHFADNDVNPRVDLTLASGQQKFSLFLSTSQFSQSVDYLQTFQSAELSSYWDLENDQNVQIRWKHYLINNDIRSVSSLFNNQSFFGGGGTENLTVDTASQLALAGTVLSERHMVSTLDLNYDKENLVEVGALLSASEFKEKFNPLRKDKKIFDYDALLRTVYKKDRNRVELQYEQVGNDYRSLGDPLRYQARKIFRISPYLDLHRNWKVFGEGRREYSRSLVPQGLTPFTIQYVSLTNQFRIGINSLRLNGNELKSTLFGRRVTTALDYTQYMGRDSLDLGVNYTEQTLVGGEIFRCSPGGRMSYQILRPKWKLSIGEEYTQHKYIFDNVHRYESLSSILVNVGDYETLLQYEIQPKDYLQEDRLHTGLFRIGRRTRQNYKFNLFVALTSLRPELKEPEVVRSGVEIIKNF